MGDERQTPEQQVRRLFEQGEQQATGALEQLVGRDSFAVLLGRMTENVMAVTRIGNDLLDVALRNLRIAGRTDLTQLGRQLARTEDKLELVLQEVERLQERLDAERGEESRGRAKKAEGASDRSTGSPSRSRRSGGRSGSNSSGGARARGGAAKSGS